MTAPGRIDFREVSNPVPDPDQVIVRIRRIGICGSDIHVFHGRHPYTSYPIVQGHEISGIVSQIGSRVEDLAVDDPVTIMPQVTCGTCHPCRHGMYHICESLAVMGFQTDGAAQERFAVDASQAVKLPEGISLDWAAMIEPISVGAHALARGGGARDKNVLVLGAGTIGNLTAQVARASGARAVMVTDISDYKLAKARDCGIDAAVNAGEVELDEAILENFGPDRADLIVECVGAQETITQAVACARKGTTIVIVGVFGEKPVVDLGLVQDRELSLVGTLMYQETDYRRAVELVGAGSLRLDPLITHRFPFAQYLEAYRAIEAAQGKTMKVMIDLE